MGNVRPGTGERMAGLARYLSPLAWRSLTSLGCERRYSPGQTLFTQGGQDKEVLVLLDGAVKVVRTELNGKRVMLAIRGRGDVVGDMAAVDQIDDRQRCATVSTVTALRGRLLTAAQFCRFASDPDIALGYVRYQNDRLRESGQRYTEHAALPVRQRLARALVCLIGQVEASGEWPALALSQEELAELIGASRNAVVGELARLREDGIVATSRCHVRVVNQLELERIAKPPPSC